MHLAAWANANPGGATLHLDDPRLRTWELGGGALSTQLDASDGPAAAAVVLDNSTYSASAKVRPLGTATWCRITVDLLR